MVFPVDKNKSSVEEDANKLLETSLAFCGAYASGPRYAGIMENTSKNAMQLFNKLTVTVRNIQDLQGRSRMYNPVIGKKVVGLGEMDAFATLQQGELGRLETQAVHLRDILNRFAHASENNYGFRVSDGNHFLLIANKERKNGEFCVTEFKVSDFCEACIAIARTC